MNRIDPAKTAGILIPALLALVFAGSAMTVTASAMAVDVSGPALYLAGLVAVVLCALGAHSRPGAVLAALGLLLTAGLYAAAHRSGLGAIRTVFATWSGEAGDPEQLALGARTLLTCGAFVLGMVFFALLTHREFVSMALFILLAVLLPCHALSETASLPAALPGLVGAVAAFALTGGLQRDLSALRAFLPAGLAVLLALALLPAAGTTWAPMEAAAQRVRSIFEQYFRFTRERVAFSISEAGYDHAGEVDDDVISMLGGPAKPHTDEVMRVDTDVDLLLRGTIRTWYTGYSWEDIIPRNRYLYYDPTHRASRDRAFSPSSRQEGMFLEAEAAVEMLREGTSTLFVPGFMEGFDMDLSTAVYYNTAGEMFLSREVAPGDRYRFTALLPQMNDALRRAVQDAEDREDERYSSILEDHIQLPQGIDGRVYALTMQVIARADNPWDRATAILRYLQGNMRYTLSPQLPPQGRDFVSHFLLDTREGYCSYYAPAMAVMGRIAGLPTRYVEGYFARPGLAALTGENAHAWAEIYFNGIGWIPFDATGGAAGSGSAPGGAPDGSTGDEPQGEDGGRTGLEGDNLPEEGGPGPGADAGAPEETPTPAPEPQDGEDPQETPEALPEGTEPDEADSPRRSSAPWGLFAGLLLAVAAVLFARWARRRLRESDPVRLCDRARNFRQKAMILYRANLTVLAHLGQAPMGGEAPDAFAARAAEQFGCPDYAVFVSAVTKAGYGRRPFPKEALDAGFAAYRHFLSALGWREKMRFTLTRIRRGLGDFSAIP